MNETSKLCTKCQVYKSFTNFSKGNDINGLRYWCKDCLKGWSKHRLQKIKESDTKIITDKICSSCKKEQSIENYNKNICEPDGFQSVCKKCRKEYRDKNKDKINIVNKLWRESNKERKYDMDKNYRANNKEKINSNKRVYEKNKRKIDLLYKLSSNIRRTMLLCFKNKNFGKNSSTLNILGCTFEEFKQHIESQFLPWMNWDNYGNACETLEYNCSWDLDHIIPMSSAETEEEVYLLNHWSNFQPLCSKVNRWEKKDNVYHVYNLELKIEK